MATRLFALLILVGSVHTGWHYAVDGLLGWAMTLAIWQWTGAYLRRIGYAAPHARRSPAGLAPDEPLSV